jgi:hypothetical protein
MGHQTETTLQAILDAMSSPCYIKENNKIVLSNQKFKNYNLNELDSKKYSIQEKDLSKTLKMCEIKLDDLCQLEECKQKITKALALL